MKRKKVRISTEKHERTQSTKSQRTPTVMIRNSFNGIRQERQERANAWLFLFLILSSGPQTVDSFVCRSSSFTCRSYQLSTLFQSRSNFGARSKANDDDDGLKEILPSNNAEVDHLEDDIANKLSVSKDRAISALSQPNPNSDLPKSNNSTISKNNNSAKRNGKPKRNGPRKRQQQQRKSKPEKEDDSFCSLLPPPMKDQSTSLDGSKGDSLSDGLSSWEDFLGVGKASSEKHQEEDSPSPLYSKMQNSRSLSSNLKKGRRQKKDITESSEQRIDAKEELPSIADLFPPDLYSTRKRKQSKSSKDSKKPSSVSPPPPSLDGVLPVSDLFYRSSQSMNHDDDDLVHEDDELPFSAEQSDQLTTAYNKIKIRRNQARTTTSPSTTSSSGKPPRRKYASPRKMVRRGMEMLVGGIPINADPPLRYVDLLFNSEVVDWNEAIVINSRDFGPMYHSSSVGKITKTEQALFCEHFVHSAMKWDICPKDLKTIVKSYTSSLLDAPEEVDEDLNIDLMDTKPKSFDDNAIPSDLKRDDDAKEGRNAKSEPKNEGTESSGLGFGPLKTMKKKVGADSDHLDADGTPHLGGELIFSIGVSSEELEISDTPSETPVLQRVLARGIAAVTACKGFAVSIEKLVLTDMDDGTTKINGEFILTLKENQSLSHVEMEKKAQRINSSLAQAMDSGDMQLALAAAAKEETGWPESVRDRVVEEFLFEDDDGDFPLYEVEDDAAKEAFAGEKVSASRESAPKGKESFSSLDITNDIIDEYDGPFGMPGSKMYHKDDIFLGGGNDGVFWDYSEQNLEGAPYKGKLGLRLVDATIQRAKERHPRVIAIGDVHGCIDELQDLLRECDYRPGDLVVFLGDLVSKGPDSLSVVQMAREIGAIGVRGNHDFEVVRWHQAIKSGVDPPLVGSEHFHIASCLSKADMKWMYSLPWYISSKDLGVLFVHAGFVSGIRLAKQNPRLMMNMRSILPDGTVTSKFFNNWPWARLWDGPQTVLFGHDADRGLQQYENAIGLDTGCVYGGRLTACILPEKRLVSVSARREYFKYRRKHYD
jgi:hypothetical protein